MREFSLVLARSCVRECVNRSKITAEHTHDIIIINKVLYRIGGGVINQRAGKTSTRVYTPVFTYNYLDFFYIRYNI